MARRFIPIDEVQSLLTDLSGRIEGLPAQSRKPLEEDIRRLRACLEQVEPNLPAGPGAAAASPARPGADAAGSIPDLQDQPGGRPLGIESPQHAGLPEALFAVHPTGLAVVSVPDLRYRMANDTYRAMMPDPSVDPVGKTIAQVWPVEEAGLASEQIEQARSSRRGLSDRYWRVFTDGPERSFAAQVVSIEWENSPAVLIVLWDTTRLAESLPPDKAMLEKVAGRERALEENGASLREKELTLRKYEATLRQNEARFRVALATLPISVFSMDRDLRYTWIYTLNARQPLEQILGRRDDEVLPLGDVTHLMDMKRSVIETGQPLRGENRLLVYGEWRDYSLNLDPILDESGQVIGLTGAALDITEQRRLEAAQREYLTQMEVQRRLSEHREKERREIARGLHDGPIQALVSTLFALRRAREDLTSSIPPEGRAAPSSGEGEGSEMRVLGVLDQVTASLKQTVQELRELVNDLRPPSLLQFGLSRVIQIHWEDIRTRYPGITFHLDLADDKNRLGEESCLALYHAYQECLNNIVRHAQASQVWIRYYPDGQEMVLEIRDNGRGFAVPENWAGFARGNHFGMAAIKERMEADGGSFTVISHPGEGTVACARAPIIK